MNDICSKLAQIYETKSLNRNDLERDMLNFLLKNGILKKKNNIFILTKNKVNVISLYTKIIMNRENNTLIVKSSKCVLYDSDLFIIPICNNAENIFVKVKVKDQLENVREVIKGVKEWSVKMESKIKGGSLMNLQMKFKNHEDRICYFCELDKSVEVKIRDQEGKKVGMYILPNIMLDGDLNIVREEKVVSGEADFRIKNCSRGFVYIFK